MESFSAVWRQGLARPLTQPESLQFPPRAVAYSQRTASQIALLRTSGSHDLDIFIPERVLFN
jgi:hypothetical protein